MVAAPKPRFTFGEYLLVEEQSPLRHEFMDGLILAMAGGTPEHARLAVAVSSLLSQQLAGKRCAVFSEALRVRAERTGFAGYPDVTVVCDALLRDPESANTVTNPTVVVEVLSPSTAEYDRTDKLRHYQTIVSLQHVVLVSYDVPQIEVWTRTEQEFTSITYGVGQTAALTAIDCSLDVDAVYRDPLAS